MHQLKAVVTLHELLCRKRFALLGQKRSKQTNPFNPAPALVLFEFWLVVAENLEWAFKHLLRVCLKRGLQGGLKGVLHLFRLFAAHFGRKPASKSLTVH